MKFKVGDKVYVRCGDRTDEIYGISSKMHEFENKLCQIDSLAKFNSGYIIRLSGMAYTFAEEDVSYTPFGEKIKQIDIKEKIVVDKIIFNDPATIVFANGERYVSKSYNEAFDEEKGLALTLLKAFGISYLDLQRMIKGATVQEKKAPKKKEEPKVDKSTLKKEKPKKKRVGRIEKTVEVEKDGSKYTIHQGKRRGIGQKLQQGDMVLVRLCKVYDWEEVEVVRELIGRPLMVDYIGEHSLRVKLPEQKRTYEFSRNEVDRI